jgi:membrane protein implicated in regulation of membrane protease activity
MTTCPWCGSNYAEFRTNCANCGGPLPLPRPGLERNDDLVTPPPAPRPIADSFAWKLVITDAWFIVGIVFTFMGTIFTFVGLALTVAIVTIFIGLPFALLGLAFLGGGLAALVWRYQKAQTTVRVLQVGQTARGQILSVERNYNVRVGGRNPWQVDYQFTVSGQNYQGQVSSLNSLGGIFQPGKPVSVLYLPEAPENNAIYPHP